MKQYNINNVIINSYDAVCTSSAGNVCRRVSFQDENGKVYQAKTARNSSAGYDIVNAYLLKKRVNIVYHVTKDNNLIIDFVNE